MSENYELARQSVLLSAFSNEELEANLKSGRFTVSAYRKNSVIHCEGDSCRNLEIILSGRVVIDRVEESGDHLTISAFYSDDILGGNLLFSATPRYPMTVSAQLPTRILEIERELLFELFCHNHDFLRSYLEFVSGNSLVLSQKLKNSRRISLRQRLLAYLEEESKAAGCRRVPLKGSKKLLAEQLGVQRTSLSRELAKMEAEGLIRFDRDSITLL